MNLRRAGFDREPGAGAGFAPGLENLVNHLVVGGVGLLGNVAEDVAAFAVEEPRAGVSGEVFVETLCAGSAVAATGQRGCDKLGGDDFLFGLEVINAQFVGPVGVNVSGEHDGVTGFLIPKMLEEELAFVRIPWPLVHRIDRGRIGRGAIGEGHHDLLGKDVPGAPGGGEGIEQPFALVETEEGVAWIEGGGIERALAVAVRLIAAVLAGIEDKEFSEAPEMAPAIEGHPGPYGQG